MLQLWASCTAQRAKLWHIAVRQELVTSLRDQGIVRAKHVGPKYNKADLFTKILTRETFEYLRDVIMAPVKCTAGTVFPSK